MQTQTASRGGGRRDLCAVRPQLPHGAAATTTPATAGSVKRLSRGRRVGVCVKTIKLLRVRVIEDRQHNARQVVASSSIKKTKNEEMSLCAVRILTGCQTQQSAMGRPEQFGFHIDGDRVVNHAFWSHKPKLSRRRQLHAETGCEKPEHHPVHGLRLFCRVRTPRCRLRPPASIAQW
jgi:hypothetical protein